jgi:hypothetical protein
MAEEERDDRARDPFKMLLEEALSVTEERDDGQLLSNPTMTTDNGQGIFEKQ